MRMKGSRGQGAKGSRDMKILRIAFLVFCAALFFAVTAHAESQVTFAWDAVSESDLAGYRLYQSDVSGKYEYGHDKCVKQISAGTETATIENIPDGLWYWVVTAYDDAGNESGPSNEVSLDLDTLQPNKPTNFRVTASIKITIGVE